MARFAKEGPIWGETFIFFFFFFFSRLKEVTIHLFHQNDCLFIPTLCHSASENKPYGSVCTRNYVWFYVIVHRLGFLLLLFVCVCVHERYVLLMLLMCWW